MIQNEELIWMKRLHQLRIITYEKLVPISKEKKSIGVKWIYKEKKRKSIGVKLIYKEKKNVKREEERYKARLEEKNYSKKQGINYNEVFALIDNIKGKLQEIEDV
jgi:hypothetical protein